MGLDFLLSGLLCCGRAPPRELPVSWVPGAARLWGMEPRCGVSRQEAVGAGGS